MTKEIKVFARKDNLAPAQILDWHLFKTKHQAAITMAMKLFEAGYDEESELKFVNDLILKGCAENRGWVYEIVEEAA
jgi:hypothetical protein